ncbi:hypothetical protein SCG7109_BH_00030 [Chlamydiales bacterium SCGC AG-110-M15]|nr:hypothetical protein SCG7109_BH_00030 [Chlamydiales bacterium SCGC AG-110-M15]
MRDLDPARQVVVARELSKKFETYHRGSVSELVESFSEKEPKGEIVLLIAPSSDSADDWSSMDPKEHVAMLQEAHGLTLKEAIKLAAQLRGVSKRDIYGEVHG